MLYYVRHPSCKSDVQITRCQDRWCILVRQKPSWKFRIRSMRRKNGIWDLLVENPYDEHFRQSFISANIPAGLKCSEMAPNKLAPIPEVIPKCHLNLFRMAFFRSRTVTVASPLAQSVATKLVKSKQGKR